ncbi:MAG: hypothetical protein WCO79_03310 [bacterium]
MEEFSQPKFESKDQRMRRLLGLRDFPKRTVEEKRMLLGSEQRLAALDAITTTTLPVSKKEVKKGIVLELADKAIISADTLRTHPLVYIGSGTDIEYPLAIGGRQIQMVDTLLSDEKMQEEVIAKITKLISAAPEVSSGTIHFTFDFGSGPEPVSVMLVSKFLPYFEEKRLEGDFVLPSDIGAIVLYASQGPGGCVGVTDAMKEKLVDGGAIVVEHQVITKNGTVTELGI